MHQISLRFFKRGITPEREKTRKKKKKRASTIYPWGIHIWNFKTIACTFFYERTGGCTDGQTTRNQYAHSSAMTVWKISVLNHLATGHPKRENECTFFDEWTDGRTQGQPETNMLPQLLRSWWHNKVNFCKNLIRYSTHHPLSADQVSSP